MLELERGGEQAGPLLETDLDVFWAIARVCPEPGCEARGNGWDLESEHTLQAVEQRLSRGPNGAPRILKIERAEEAADDKPNDLPFPLECIYRGILVDENGPQLIMSGVRATGYTKEGCRIFVPSAFCTYVRIFGSSFSDPAIKFKL